MKKLNSTLEFGSQRSELLLKKYRESLAAQSRISLKRAFKEAAEAPAPRFWVSEARAVRVISMMLKGEDVLGGMHSEKRKMYIEIFQRVKSIREARPDLPLGDIVFNVVNSPAPCSYMKWHTAAMLIRKMRDNQKLNTI